MRYKKFIIISVLSVFVLLSIAGVCAGDANDTAVAGEDIAQKTDDIIQEKIASENDEDIVKNSIPVIGETDDDVTNDTFYQFFDGEGYIRDNVTSQALTFRGSFSNLGNGIVIDRPISLIGDGAVLYDVPIAISSSNVIIDGFSFISTQSCISITDASDVSVVNNDFDVSGCSDDCNIVIRIFSSEALKIMKNDIQLYVDNNKTIPNKAILAECCEDVDISNNTIVARVPSRAIDWSMGEVYSEGIHLEDCKGVVLAQNIIGAISTGYMGEYDSLYGVHITGENIDIHENLIGAIGAPYSYGLLISAKDFNVSANIIFAGLEFSLLLDESDLNFFNTGYSDKNVSESFKDLASYAESKDFKKYLSGLSSGVSNPYADAISVEGNSYGVIEFNLIAATAVSTHGIYSADWAGDVKLQTALNLILEYGNSAFGMSLSGSETLVEYSLIFMLGNFTTGIASCVDNIGINHVVIDALGSNEGIPLGKDSMGIETVCVHIVSGNANITNSVMNTSGEFTVDFKGKGAVTDNYLVARQFTGDASVDYIENDATVMRNVPKMDKKSATRIDANAVTTTYNINRDLIITLKDSNSRPLGGLSIKVDLNGIKTYVTDENGQVKIQTGSLTPNSYVAKIIFEGNEKRGPSNMTVGVVVKKATPKIIAKKKVYRADAKTKKFKITLKDNTGKPISNVKVKLIVKKSKMKAKVIKTGAKGKATFKVKISKKGKYQATVKFAGNEYYTPAAKKVKIKIR